MVIERLARWVVAMRFGHRMASAERDSLVGGVINNKAAQMRALHLGDVEEVKTFINGLSSDWLKYFNPHSFDKNGLISVVKSRALMKYGLFVDGRLQGYALLKVAPTGSAFIGLLVHPGLSGLGLGSFIMKYLYW